MSQSGGHAAPGGMHSHPSSHGGGPLPGPGAMPSQPPAAQPPSAAANLPTHPPVSFSTREIFVNILFHRNLK